MSDPKPYDLSNPEELLRLVHEVYGYLHTSLDDGTDRPGRCYALNALRSIEKSDPSLFSCLATCAAILRRSTCPPAVAADFVLGAVKRSVEQGEDGTRHSATTTAPCCASCKFVVRKCPDTCCQRNPPSWTALDGTAQWPRVADIDWCGEHQPKAVVDE